MTKKKLNNMEFSILTYFLTRAFFIGITFSCLTRIIKQDSWIVPLISIFIGLIFILLINYIFNYKESMCISEKIKQLFNSKIAFIINILIILIGIFYNIANSVNLNNFIHTQFLNKTPILVISILFLLVTLYILTKGINVITKTSVIIFYVCITLVFISFMGLSMKFSLSNLKPYFQFDSKELFKSLRFYYAFNMTPMLFLTVIPKSNIKNPKILKSMSLSFIISTITTFISIILILGVFGYELTMLYEYPEFQVLKQISIVGLSSRIESILVMQWLFDLFIFNVFIIYFICNSIKQLVTKKDLKINLIYFIYCIILVTTLNYISRYNIYIENFILRYAYNYISIITLSLTVIICIKIKLRKKLRYENKSSYTCND